MDKFTPGTTEYGGTQFTEPEALQFEAALEKVSLGKVETDDDFERERRRQELEHSDQRVQAELEAKEDELENLRTDRVLKKDVARKVFWLLIGETSVLFLIMLFQGFHFLDFFITDTTLNIFIAATIAQISLMATIITKYLFSNNGHVTAPVVVPSGRED